MSNPTIKKGFFQMPAQDYFDVPCFSNSLAKVLISKSPLHALTWMNDETPVSKIRQQNYDFGTAAHLAVFQHSLLDKMVVEDNPANKNSKVYKEWRAEVPPYMLVLPTDSIDKLTAMREALERKTTVMDILKSPGYAERSGFFEDPVTDAWVKIRPDWIFEFEGRMCVADYKTCTPEALADWDKTVANFNYHLQSFLYTWGARMITGVDHSEFFWIAQEKEAPFEARVFVADESMVTRAQEEIREALNLWAQCQEKNEFEGYPDIINYTYLPAWRMGKTD